MNNFEKLILDVKEQNYPILITISGFSCSGKTTLASKLHMMFLGYEPSIMQQDDYYKDLIDIPRYNQRYRNMESVEAFRCGEFIGDVKKLLDGNDILIPKYDIASNKRLSKDTYMRSSKIIIAEGLHTILLLKNMDKSVRCHSIFMDTAIDTCIKRRVDRDIKFLQVDPDRVAEYFKKVIIPNYKEYHDCMIRMANEVITGEYC